MHACSGLSVDIDPENLKNGLMIALVAQCCSATLRSLW